MGFYVVRYLHIFKHLPGKTLVCFRDSFSAPFSNNLFFKSLPFLFRLVGNLVDHRHVPFPDCYWVA